MKSDIIPTSCVRACSRAILPPPWDGDITRLAEAGSSTQDFPVSKTVRNTCLFFINYPVSGALLERQAVEQGAGLLIDLREMSLVRATQPVSNRVGVPGGLCSDSGRVSPEPPPPRPGDSQEVHGRVPLPVPALPGQTRSPRLHSDL